MKKTSHILSPLLIVSLLIIQLMSPITVFADGETPPVTSETAEEVTPPDEPTATDETPTEGAVPAEKPVEEAAPAEVTSTEGDALESEPSEELAPDPETQKSTVAEALEQTPAEETAEPEDTAAEEASGAAETATEEPASEQEADLTVAEVFEQVPTGTEILVINEEGQVESLATEEAAAIVADADPMWCPDGQAPTPGANGCSPAFTYGGTATPLTDLIAWLTANDPNQAGTIWIEDAYDSAAEGVAGFTLDGGSYTNLDNHNLTIQGGWNGTSGSTNISGTSTFTGNYLLINSWNASVTLNDIVVDGVSNNGIKVTTTGDINLENVESSNNTSTGAYLDNTTSTGNITLSGTNTFNGNGTYGLRAYSKGNISLNNVTASKNTQGAHLKNNKGNGDITLTGTNTFNKNTDYGLVAVSQGNISLNNMTASQNSQYGADLSGIGSIALTGTSTFYNNSTYGLRAFSDGNIRPQQRGGYPEYSVWRISE